MVKRLLIATIVAIGPIVAAAQGLITGHITDVRTGEPLIGASVIVKSEKGKGVVTDIDGNFSLQTKVEAPLTLRVEYVGYRALDVDVYDFEEPVEIQLIDNSNRLNEVVVLGYTQVRVSLLDCVEPHLSMQEMTLCILLMVCPSIANLCSQYPMEVRLSMHFPISIQMILRR